MTATTTYTVYLSNSNGASIEVAAQDYTRTGEGGLIFTVPAANSTPFKPPVRVAEFAPGAWEALVAETPQDE